MEGRRERGKRYSESRRIKMMKTAEEKEMSDKIQLKIVCASVSACMIACVQCINYGLRALVC